MAERAAKQLELNKSELPNSITEVIATLSRAGFDAYIVGGGVRDTLLGLKPKDFDAVTDAKPHEIKDVFGKRCRIIGRRFQLAHVYSGRELIEVATFRGPPTSNANTNKDGMIVRDNVWGDIKQDFSRRDFSINALYYQPLKGVVHDFCGALDDIRNKTIRLLGHAPVRIEEDPVRLLRALRFKAKLGFEFDTELAAQFHDGNWALLEQISPHRLYDETQKMFTGGYLVPLLPLLFDSGAIDSLFIYPPSEPSALVKQVAINTDKRIAAGQSINPAFFYAAILWENYLHQLEKSKKRNMPFAEAQMQAASKVIDRQRIKTAIPKFAEQFIRDIWVLQPKLSAPRTKQIEQLAEHPRFRAGFDFLLLREQCGDSEHPLSESTNGMGDWWQTYQTLTENEQQQAINNFDENIRRGAYKRERGRQPKYNAPDDHHDNNNPDNNSNAKPASSTPNPTKRSPLPAADAPHQSSALNNATNIPSKRRRRVDSAVHVDNNAPIAPAMQSSVVKNPSIQQSAKPMPSHKVQPQQDRHEWAQLQQLSLANTSANTNTQSANHRQAPKPAPLFVIEHERVVPPLSRQLPVENNAQKPKSRQVSARNKAAANQQQSPVATATALAQKPNTAAKNDSKNSAQQLPEKPVRKAEKSSVSVAQTPQLVMTNNEPIPSKRRRRLPSHQPSNQFNNESSNSASKSAHKAKASTTYEKKAPKPAVAAKTAQAKPAVKSAQTQSATHNSKADKAQPALMSTPTGNKGPIPSKRRRRQPSSHTA